jgi:hypothetical protein
LSEELGSEHLSPASHGSTMVDSYQVFELRDEVQAFLTLQEDEYAQLFAADEWIAKLSYLSYFRQFK